MQTYELVNAAGDHEAMFGAENDPEALFEAIRILKDGLLDGEFYLQHVGPKFITQIAILDRYTNFTTIEIPDEIAQEEA